MQIHVKAYLPLVCARYEICIATWCWRQATCDMFNALIHTTVMCDHVVAWRNIAGA